MPFQFEKGHEEESDIDSLSLDDDDVVSEVGDDELNQIVQDINTYYDPTNVPSENRFSKLHHNQSSLKKSSIKTSSNIGQRKVQFSMDTKSRDNFDIDDPLGDLLLSDDENQKPKAKDKPLTTSATNVTSRTDQKSTTKEKPSLMDDLFGNTTSSSKSDAKMMTAPSKPLSGLGGGLGGSTDAKMNESERKNKRTSFMDDLFGKPTKDSGASNSNEFVIDEKYKKPQQPSQDKAETATSKWSGPSSGLGMEVGGRSRRRGNAVLSQDTPSDLRPSLNVDDLFDRVTSGKQNSALEPQNVSIPSSRRNETKQMEVSSSSQLQNNSTSQQQQELAYTNTSTNNNASTDANMFAFQNEKLMQDQSRQMQEFERQQQEQFQRDMDDQRRILELKQQEYRNAMEQQKHNAQEQAMMIQNRHASILKQQQMQSEILLKQMQSQMESEVKMKNEMMRHQITMLGEIQMQTPHETLNMNEILHKLRINEKTSGDENISIIRQPKSIGEVEAFYKEREERIRKLHGEEIKEVEERLSLLKDRAKADLDEFQEDIQFERQRRITDLQRQQEEHQDVIEALKNEYSANLEKMKEISQLGNNVSVDSEEAMRTAESLIDKVNINTSNLSDLQKQIEKRVGKQVDIREAILKKKDEELKELRMKSEKQQELDEEEQNSLRHEIESLQKQLKGKDLEIIEREKQLSLEKTKLESDKRKFKTERDIMMAQFEANRQMICEQRRTMDEERKGLHHAMEEEHRKIISTKMKLAVHKRLHPDVVNPYNNGYEEDKGNDENENKMTRKIERNESFEGAKHIQTEMVALAEAFEDEKQKLETYKKHFHQNQLQLLERKRELKTKRKALNDVAKSLLKLEKSLVNKLHSIESFAQAASKHEENCRSQLNDCLALEASRHEILMDSEKRLSAVTKVEKSIDKKKMDLVKERKRLLNTRNSILCSSCQQPLADRFEMQKHGLTNLGLRTAGDGGLEKTTSVINLATLRRDADKDQEFLSKENLYLQSIGS